MTQKQAIQLFEDRKVRTVWDERTETWYFSVLDVISALTDTVNPTDYFKERGFQTIVSYRDMIL